MPIQENKLIPCMGCGANVSNIDGPTHKYLVASPGCWKLFGDILAKEYGDPAYMSVHRLTVDAYALQHVGIKSPQTIQSMNLHLMALCAALKHNVTYDFIPKIMNKLLKEYKDKEAFTWLAPPHSLGELTITDIVKAETPEEHTRLVHDWAKSTWDAWSPHHKKTEGYLRSIDY